MKLTKLNNDKFINVNLNKYKIDWLGKSPSNSQKLVKQFLYPFWKTHFCCEEYRIPGSLLRIDLINFTRKIAIEVDGPQHESYNIHFHRNRLGYYNSIKRDFLKERWLEKNGFKFIRILESDLNNLSIEYLEKLGINI